MNQVILAPILLYFIVYGLIQQSSIYNAMNMSQLLSEANRARLPELRRTNILILILVSAIFIDSFVKTILVAKLSDHMSKPTMELLKNFPIGLVVFVIGMTLMLMHDQTDPADMISIGLTILLMFLFFLLTATFYVVLFAQDIVMTMSKKDEMGEEYNGPLVIFQTMIQLCAILFIVLIYRTILTKDPVTLPLAGLFLYILLGTVFISNVVTFIMVTKLKWNSSITMQMFRLPGNAIGLIAFGLLLLTYWGSYPEWIVYPTPILFLYWILTTFAEPSNYAIVKSLAMTWTVHNDHKVIT